MDFIFEFFVKTIFKSLMQLFVWQPIKQYGFTQWLMSVLVLLSLAIALFFAYRHYNPPQAIKQKSKRKKR